MPTSIDLFVKIDLQKWLDKFFSELFLRNQIFSLKRPRWALF